MGQQFKFYSNHSASCLENNCQDESTTFFSLMPPFDDKFSGWNAFAVPVINFDRWRQVFISQTCYLNCFCCFHEKITVHTQVVPNMAIILVEKIVKFVIFSGSYEMKPGIPICRYFFFLKHSLFFLAWGSNHFKPKRYEKRKFLD